MPKTTKKQDVTDVEAKEVVNQRDPILDEEVSFTMKVEQVNVILSLLGKLPYSESAEVITNLRNYVISQLQERRNAANSSASEENTEEAA